MNFFFQNNKFCFCKYFFPHTTFVYIKNSKHLNFQKKIKKKINFKQKRRERGRIDVRGVKLVEPAILHGDGGDAHAPNV